MNKLKRPVAYYNDLEELIGTTIKKVDKGGVDEILILTECGKRVSICSSDHGYDEPGSYIYFRDGDEVELKHMVFFELLTEDELTAIEEQEEIEWDIVAKERKEVELLLFAKSLGYELVKKDVSNGQ